MSKKKYSLGKFDNNTIKHPLAYMSGCLLSILDRIFNMFQRYAADSYEQSPRWILHNMMRNSETIFSLGVLDINYGAGTSSEGQSSQELSSPLEGDSSSSCLTHVSENLEMEITTGDNQESIELCETPGGNSKEDFKVLIRKNFVQIKSMSIIKQNDSVVVEIDFDPPCISEVGSPKKSEQDTSPSKKTSSPGTADRKSKSSSISPSKRIKATDSQSVTSESYLSIDYSDPNILDFLSKRLLSILSCRKTCMKQIHDCYKFFRRDVFDLSSTIRNMLYVIKKLPMKNESYLTDDLLKLRYDLINKGENMMTKIGPFLEDARNDENVLKECLTKLENFEEEHVSFLTKKGESAPTFDDLKKIELGLKEICKNADEKVILEGERRTILIHSSSDFEWFVNHFVKFLIITELLVSDPTDSSQTGANK